MMKVCKHCGRELPEENFGKCSKSSDGLQWWCNECRSKYGKEQRAAKKREKEDIKNKIFDAPANTDSELSKYSSRELLTELRKRGFSGELTYTQTVNV